MQRLFGMLMVAASACTIALSGCGDIESKDSRVSFITKYAPIEFSFPSSWHVTKDETPYDLQCFSRFEEMNTGVFVFKDVDVAAESRPIDIFWNQVKDIESKRTNFTVLEETQRYEDDSRLFTTVTYTGEKDSSRNCYRFSLIEFKGDDSKFAIVLQVALPGAWEDSKSTLEEITRSAKAMP